MRRSEAINRHRSGHDEEVKSAVADVEWVGQVSEGRTCSQRQARGRKSAKGRSVGSNAEDAAMNGDRRRGFAHSKDTALRVWLSSPGYASR